MKIVKLTLSLARNFKKDFRKTTNDLIAEHGDKFCLKSPFYTMHIIADPKLMQHVLQTNNKNFPHPPNPIYDPIENPNVELSYIELYERWEIFNRKHLYPSLSEKSVKPMTETLVQETVKQLDTWNKYTKPNGQPFSIYRNLQVLTIN